VLSAPVPTRDHPVEIFGDDGIIGAFHIAARWDSMKSKGKPG